MIELSSRILGSKVVALIQSYNLVLFLPSNVESSWHGALLRSSHSLSHSTLESEIQPLVPVQFPCHLIVLIYRSLANRHRIPDFLLPFIQNAQIRPLRQKCHERQCTDGDQDFVPLVVVWRIIRAIYL